MSLVLYHYVHCPYCIRVRMALGFLNLPYESRVVPYDDHDTPISLTGIKMLPILTIDGKAMNESLDIIRKLDTGNTLKHDTDLSGVEDLIKEFNNPVHSLAMPYWISTPEFSPSAKAYFLKQKEAKRGPFGDLVKNAQRFNDELVPLFRKLEERLRPFYESSQLKILDIMIASHLWGLYVVPEFQFPEKVHAYLQNVKRNCRFNYHQDYWS